MAELEKSWYVKYRPKTMEEYSGPAIKNIVQKRFSKREDMPHVILIQGTRGCGKTTFSRIITKYYACNNPNPDGSPCECCEACNEINETLLSGETGIETPGVVEVDATTCNGKEAIQEILEEAVIPPMYTNFKILIMDEFHMVTPQAQNSMLKIVEDIPPHLVIIFATTNPEKILQTIKSRVQLKLEAKKQSLGDMTHRLMQIAQMENLNTSEKALEIIAKKGDRVPRECINLLEDIAKTYDGEVTVDNVKERLGDSGSEKYIKYFNAANTGLGEIMGCIYELRVQDVKMTDYITGLMTFALDALYIMHGINLDDYTPEYVKQIRQLFNNYESQDFDMLLQILETAERSISDDNEKKNEVTLTIAAMRISKIKLLAEGLAEEQEQAIAENKISMVEHSKLLKKTQEEVSEQLKMAVTPNLIKESFRDTAVVMEGIDLGAQLNMDMVQLSTKETKEFKAPPSSSTKEIDDFFNNQ